LKPLTEFLVISGIIDEPVYGVDDDVRALSIREALKQSADLSY